MSTSSSSLLLSVTDRLYRALLAAYPAAFRRAYGPDLVQLFHDCSRDALRRAGLRGLCNWWGRAVVDLAATAAVQRVAQARIEIGRRKTRLAIALLALVLSLATGYVNTHNAEVRAPMLCLLVSTVGLGIARPRHAWRWALMIGLAVPLSQALAVVFRAPVPYPNDVRHVLSSTFILIPAMLGAYVGAAIRSAMRSQGNAPLRSSSRRGSETL